MTEMRGEVDKKTPKKEMDNPSFLWCYMADFWDYLSSYMKCNFRESFPVKENPIGLVVSESLRYKQQTDIVLLCIVDDFMEEQGSRILTTSLSIREKA